MVANSGMLSPQVTAYVAGEHGLASLNHRPVGGDKASDRPVIDARQSPNISMTTGEYQTRLLKEGKAIIVDEYKDPKHKGKFR